MIEKQMETNESENLTHRTKMGSACFNLICNFSRTEFHIVRTKKKS